MIHLAFPLLIAVKVVYFIANIVYGIRKMPKKPAAKGPFFFFMLEFRRREEARGKSFSGGMDQVMKEAGPSWNRLKEAERQVYKDQAAAYKNHPKQNYGEKYTAQGVPYSQVEMEKRELLKKQQTIGLAISEMIQTAVHNNALEKMQMFFISVNYFCKTSKDLFVPAELAMVRYNLESGVQAKLHELINPVKLPLGLALEAKQFSEETHDLPLPPNALGETDLDNVLQKILSFTDYNSKSPKQFPVITEEKQVPMVESILAQCYEDLKIEYKFLVIPLGEFFFHLKRATEKYGLDICAFPSKTMADILLKKDTYEYTSGISCDFHEKQGNTRFCALSKAVRWTYILSDNCCLDLSIEPIAGTHLPLNADTTLCLNMAETTSYTNQGQSDGLSMVSSVQTNYTLPSIHKYRSTSPFRNYVEEKRSFMSRVAGPSTDTKKYPAASENPFHMIDVNDSVYDPNLPRKSTEQIASPIKSCKTQQDRDAEAGVIRQPAVTESGRGRGALLVNNSFKAAVPAATRRQFFADISSIGTNSSSKLSDDDEY